MADIFRSLMLYVPESDLTALAKTHKLSVDGRKHDIARTLIKNISEDDLWDRVLQFTRAGRSVVSWYVPKKVNVPNFTKNAVEGRLTAHYESNPFQADLEFQLTPTPEVVSAQWLTRSTALLELARMKDVPRWIGLEFVERAETSFARAVIRTATNFIECWGDQDTAKASGSRLGLILGLGETVKVVLADQELVALMDKLSAELWIAQVKDDSGDYDTIEVVASPNVRDLRKAKAYQENIAGKKSLRLVIAFNAPPNGQQVRLEITRSGGFWFRGFVDEEAVEHVLSIIRSIKGF